MRSTAPQILIYIVLFALFLLLFLLGETFLRIPIMLVFLGWSTVFLKPIAWEKVLVYKSYFILWGLFLTFLTISFFTSLSFPLSLRELFMHYSVFYISTLFLLSKKNDLLRVHGDYFLVGLLITSFVLVCVSVVAQATVPSAGSLPPLNVLYPTFGHNHLAAVLLFALPASFYFLVKKSSSLTLFVFVLFAAMLVVSWGRIALAIGTAQIGLLFILGLQKTYGSFASFVRRAVGLVMVFFGIVLLVVFVSAIRSWYSPTHYCWLPQIEKAFCKPLREEPRLSYWYTAISATSDAPLVGHGPGTFVLLDKKYRPLPTASSSFAHNAFLQHFAELGVLGGVSFLALVVYVVYAVYKKMKQQKQFGFSHVVLAIALGQFVNAFFDYDLSFSGIYLLLFVMMALTLKQRLIPLIPQQKKKHVVLVSKIFFFKCFMALLSFVLVTIAGVFVYTEVLIKMGKTTEAIDIFPYFNEQNKILLDAAQTSLEARSIAQRVYFNHPEVYEELLNHEEDALVQQQYYARLVRLNPWQSYWLIKPDVYIKTQQLEVLAQELEYLHGFLLKQERVTNSYFDAQREVLARHYILLSKAAYEQTNYSLGEKAFLRAVNLNAWVLDGSFIPIRTKSLPDNRVCELAASVAHISPHFFGVNEPEYAQLFSTCFKECLVGSCSQVSAGVTENIRTFPSFTAE